MVFGVNAQSKKLYTYRNDFLRPSVGQPSDQSAVVTTRMAMLARVAGFVGKDAACVARLPAVVGNSLRLAYPIRLLQARLLHVQPRDVIVKLCGAVNDDDPATVKELAAKLTDDRYLHLVMNEHRPNTACMYPERALQVRLVNNILGSAASGVDKDEVEEMFEDEDGERLKLPLTEEQWRKMTHDPELQDRIAVAQEGFWMSNDLIAKGPSHYTVPDLRRGPTGPPDKWPSEEEVIVKYMQEELGIDLGDATSALLDKNIGGDFGGWGGAAN